MPSAHITTIQPRTLTHPRATFTHIHTNIDPSTSIQTYRHTMILVCYAQPVHMIMPLTVRTGGNDHSNAKRKKKTTATGIAASVRFLKRRLPSRHTHTIIVLAMPRTNKLFLLLWTTKTAKPQHALCNITVCNCTLLPSPVCSSPFASSCIRF